MNSAAEKRFGWINGFINACLNAIFVDINIQNNEYSTLTISNFLTKYVNRMRLRQSEKRSWPEIRNSNLNQKELAYLFHLEGELWGQDYENYVTFFPRRNQLYDSMLQTFLLVHGFFLIERWLDLFINIDNRRSERAGRSKRRKSLFGEDGFFTKKYNHLSMIMGYPANLCSSTTKVFSIFPINNGWNSHQNTTIPERLEQFYQSVTNNKHRHYSKIIESALINSRKKLPRHIFPNIKTIKTKKLKKSCRGLKATWYDVLWIYSESFRYHPVCPSDYCRQNPFYWNRTVRWLTSAIVTGLFFIIQRSLTDNRLFENCWIEAKRQDAFFSNIFGESRENLFREI